MKKSKVIILGGTPRAGKTTIANRLVKKGFKVLHFDQIVHAIHDGLPEVTLGNGNKREYWSNQEMASEKLYLLFETLIKDFIDEYEYLRIKLCYRRIRIYARVYK